MRIEAPPRRRGLVSLTPLIDVVFILLVFFMLASSFVQWREISVSVPADGKGTPSDLPALVVSVYPDGRLELGGQALAPEQLSARLLEALRDEPARQVLLQPQGEVALQELVNALERLSAAGVGNVQLSRGS